MRNPEQVRNPLLQLPAPQKIKELPSEARSSLRDLLKEISQDARSRAKNSWRKGKAPMAVY